MASLINHVFRLLMASYNVGKCHIIYSFKIKVCVVFFVFFVLVHVACWKDNAK